MQPLLRQRIGATIKYLPMGRQRQDGTLVTKDFRYPETMRNFEPWIYGGQSRLKEQHQIKYGY